MVADSLSSKLHSREGIGWVSTSFQGRSIVTERWELREGQLDDRAWGRGQIEPRDACPAGWGPDPLGRLQGVNTRAAGLRQTFPCWGARGDGRRNGRQELAVSMLAVALPLCSQPATYEDGKGDNCNDKDCRCPSGKTRHWTLSRENPPAFCRMVFDSDSICISSVICSR